MAPTADYLRRDRQTFGREREAREYYNRRQQYLTTRQRTDRSDSSLSVGPFWTQTLTGTQGAPWSAFQNNQVVVARREWIDVALSELDSIDDEVAEEAFPEIRPATKDRTRRIIFSLSTQPIPPTVYPTGDGEIALYFKSPVSKGSVLILVGNDGQGACFSYVNGKNRRARYDDASELPDVFIRAQLRQLALA